MAWLTWSYSGATRSLAAAGMEWYAHAAGSARLWFRLTAPWALAAAWFGGGGRPFAFLAALSVAPVAAGMYALGYQVVRLCVKVPLQRLKLLDTALLSGAAGASASVLTLAVAGEPSWVVWLPSGALVITAWALNWLHEGMPARPGEGALPPAPDFRRPVAGPVTAGYRSYHRSHTGVDVGAPPGTPVTAPTSGVVVHAGPLDQWGFCVIIDHGAGWTTLYAHLGRLLVRKGAAVTPGEVIAASGSSGISTGPHVHLELRFRGRPVNPAPLLKGAGG